MLSEVLGITFSSIGFVVGCHQFGMYCARKEIERNIQRLEALDEPLQDILDKHIAILKEVNECLKI